MGSFPPPESIQAIKRALRAQWLRERMALPPEMVAAAGERIRRHVEAWPPFHAAHTVLAYMAFRNEIDLTPLFGDYPKKRWVLPRMVAPGELALHLYQPGALQRHQYGMLEPAPECPLVDPEEIELAFIPGVAFDGYGFRLGYGGGYFDRLLPRLKGITVGVTHARFLIDTLPHTPTDGRVQWILTETGWVQAQSPE
ncbi:MAG: 5-formyltetrahydrofolate cyclo-ligase [Anaerolineae bacterium]|nr:5-formyltetrahydrofolate cyclo-ligase [Thermoflexus sp.]MDW8064431.1 5-formyltetrahydrofolate cyclo-ligase [Anaerolineae bacterium]